MTKAFKLNWHKEVPDDLRQGVSAVRWTEVSSQIRTGNTFPICQNFFMFQIEKWEKAELDFFCSFC